MNGRFAPSLVAVRLVAGLASLIAGLVAGGCGSSSSSASGFKPVRARFFLEAAVAQNLAVTLPQSGVQIAINPQPVLTEGDVINVELVQVDLGKCLAFQLTPSAARDLYRITGAHQGRRFVLTLNDRPVGARRIDGALSDGVLLMFVEVPDAALPELVGELKRSAVEIQRGLARK